MPYIILAVIAVVLVLWFINMQGKLVKLDELCKNSLSQIGVQQSSRWDALTSLVQLTKNYSAHEASTLEKVIAARQQITGASSAADADFQENQITQALSRLIAVGEAYPELKADKMYSQTMNSVNSYEENVRMSRMVFNDTVTKFNGFVRQIPANIVASMLHFTPKEYLQEVTAKADMPSMM